MRLLLTHTPNMRANYYGERALNGLRELADVKTHELGDALSPTQLIEAAHDVDVIVADRLTTGPAEIFENLPNLVALVRCAVDIRNIDVAAASAAGVLVTQARPGFIESVSELIVGFLVDLSRGISRSQREYDEGRAPAALMGRQLSGSTVGIIGYGSIGRYFAKVAAALGMNVLVNDPHVSVEDDRFEQVEFGSLLAASDYVVCLAVATEETENLMNASSFEKMKRDATFINVSRGNLVDEAALAEALRTGRIAAAALDVGRALDQMPTLDLAMQPNVIATPHIGGLTPPAIEAQALDTVAQVRAIVSGALPHGAVNAENWQRRKLK